jgi:recombinational DNA repair protein (RecF pathway)
MVPRNGLDLLAKRKKSHHCPSRELNPGHPASSLVTLLAELRQSYTCVCYCFAVAQELLHELDISFMLFRSAVNHLLTVLKICLQT